MRSCKHNEEPKLGGAMAYKVEGPPEGLVEAGEGEGEEQWQLIL